MATAPMRGWTPHGYGLTPEDERLLRGPPPPEALRWCEAAVGPRSRAVAVAPLEGGTASAVHAVAVRGGDGQVRDLVLRRYVRADWLEEDPDVPRREAAALEVVEACPLPTPRLVAVDERGDAAAAPAVLMTRLPGGVVWRPADREAFLAGLARVLPEIHATPLAAGAGIPDYQPYALELAGPPSWTRRPETWRRAIAIFRGPAPAHERCFIHRDHHPGNVLWDCGAVSGVVDWANASVGAPDADVGHCRVNLAGALGPDAADRFLEVHRALTGPRAYEPYWDVVAALGGHEEEAFAPADERFLARALAQL